MTECDRWRRGAEVRQCMQCVLARAAHAPALTLCCVCRNGRATRAPHRRWVVSVGRMGRELGVVQLARSRRGGAARRRQACVGNDDAPYALETRRPCRRPHTVEARLRTSRRGDSDGLIQVVNAGLQRDRRRRACRLSPRCGQGVLDCRERFRLAASGAVVAARRDKKRDGHQRLHLATGLRREGCTHDGGQGDSPHPVE